MRIKVVQNLLGICSRSLPYRWEWVNNDVGSGGPGPEKTPATGASSSGGAPPVPRLLVHDSRAGVLSAGFGKGNSIIETGIPTCVAGVDNPQVQLRSRERDSPSPLFVCSVKVRSGVGGAWPPRNSTATLP